MFILYGRLIAHTLSEVQFIDHNFIGIIRIRYQYRTENNVLSGYRKTYLMSGAHICQRSRHVLTICVQRQLEWGLSRCTALLLPP
jgi:hypothetical protein